MLPFRNYEEIPRSVKDYVDFVFNSHDLDMTSCLYFENKRRDLHEKMVNGYGLKYEYTRTAVDGPTINVNHCNENICRSIDSNLRYIYETQPEARL